MLCLSKSGQFTDCLFAKSHQDCFIGTIAMLLVGGGMFVHNIDAIHYALGSCPDLFRNDSVDWLSFLLL